MAAPPPPRSATRRGPAAPAPPSPAGFPRRAVLPRARPAEDLRDRFPGDLQPGQPLLGPRQPLGQPRDLTAQLIHLPAGRRLTPLQFLDQRTHRAPPNPAAPNSKRQQAPAAAQTSTLQLRLSLQRSHTHRRCARSPRRSGLRRPRRRSRRTDRRFDSPGSAGSGGGSDPLPVLPPWRGRGGLSMSRWNPPSSLAEYPSGGFPAAPSRSRRG